MGRLLMYFKSLHNNEIIIAVGLVKVGMLIANR